MPAKRYIELYQQVRRYSFSLSNTWRGDKHSWKACIARI